MLTLPGLKYKRIVDAYLHCAIKDIDVKHCFIMFLIFLIKKLILKRFFIFGTFLFSSGPIFYSAKPTKF